MFEILFGWRNASKCKKLIKQVQCRLKLLKNKKCSIVMQLRHNVAQLLRHGHEQRAFEQVEQLYKDETLAGAYDLLDIFSELIIINLVYIRKHKDCPNDIKEAVSTLIFASARCGDLPELPLVRKLFGERYGQSFVTVALKLLPGNLVNNQVKESLSNKPVPDELKYKLLAEITVDRYQLSPLRLEYHPDTQQEQDKSLALYTESPTVVHKDVIVSPQPSPESSTKLANETAYVDDIEEYQRLPISQEDYDQDQRVFLFRSPVSLSKKRSKKRSASKESKVSDMESRIYYDTSRKCRRKTNSGHVKLVPACTCTRTVDDDCPSLNRPCYICIGEGPQHQKVNGTITKMIQPQAPYSRAATMQPNRTSKRGSDNDDLVRAKSLAFKVHPKLPDYNELEATFLALKRETLQYCKAKA